MAFQPLLSLGDIPAKGMKSVLLEDNRSILIGQADGKIFACLNRCPHSAAPLSIGRLQGDQIMCAWHGWVFNVHSGDCVPENPGFKLTQFPVKVEGSQIFVDIPEQVKKPAA